MSAATGIRSSDIPCTNKCAPVLGTGAHFAAVVYFRVNVVV